MAKILIIDDDIQVLDVITSFLKRSHHEIITAVNGLLGIRQLETQEFDLIITDIIKPEEDGIGVLIWLLNHTKRPKVIAMSGGSASLDHAFLFEMCNNLHADKTLTKPFNYEALTNAVSEVLGRVGENSL